MHRIISGDVLRFAAHYRGPKFHAVLCDPPYELGFMGKSWDSRGVSFRAETWSAIRSLLAPGAHLLAFGGTRTFHRIACAIEDAGFEIRDTLGWLYGSGFPKSHDVSKAIDREAGAEREKTTPRNPIGTNKTRVHLGYRPNEVAQSWNDSGAATDAARAWQGYGTALKPAWEPVVVARNPLCGTVAQNVLQHGAGALNIDISRVPSDEDYSINTSAGLGSRERSSIGFAQGLISHPHSLGRWPANIIHDGGDEVTEVLGDAQRFFYCAKASKTERDRGLDGFEMRIAGAMDGNSGRSGKRSNSNGDGLSRARNHHPTVKPIALTEYLARLILPAAVVGDRRILVPFAGSGSECIGAMLAGWETIVGVEREDEYVKIARARLEYHGTKRD
jgi:site-specific DNA-methyltransferase (adenine-specific)